MSQRVTVYAGLSRISVPGGKQLTYIPAGRSMSVIVYTRWLSIVNSPMPEKKTELVSFRVTPTFKRALKLASEADKRSQSNFLDKLVSDYCAQQGLSAMTPAPERLRTRKR